MSLVRVVGAPWSAESRRPFVFEAVPADVARRLESGEVGDLGALSGYVARANRVASASLGAAGATALWAAFSNRHAWVALAAIFGVGAVLDWLRGRLGSVLRIAGKELRVRGGQLDGQVLRREDIVAIGFGAPARGSARAPETFWRGDFTGAGDSHLIVVRLSSASVHARRIVVPEASFAAARHAVERLERWRAQS